MCQVADSLVPSFVAPHTRTTRLADQIEDFDNDETGSRAQRRRSPTDRAVCFSPFVRLVFPVYHCRVAHLAHTVQTKYQRFLASLNERHARGIVSPINTQSTRLIDACTFSTRDVSPPPPLPSLSSATIEWQPVHRRVLFCFPRTVG